MTINVGESDLYVRPVDDPDAPWREIGRGVVTFLREHRDDEVAATRFVRAIEKFVLTVTVAMGTREMRALRRRLMRTFNPRPLARGCLPASKLARRGWR